MNETVRAANRLKIEQALKNLKRRNMRGHYCEDGAEAVAFIEELVQKMEKTHPGISVGWGGSETLNQIGIKQRLHELGIKTIDPYTNVTPEESVQKRFEALGSDLFLMSTNAVTLDGELMNIDGMGNRVAALCFGPKSVVIVVGANKIVRNLTEGYERMKNCACPPNSIRLKKETPCALNGKCNDCLIPGETICANTVVTRMGFIKDRIHVIFINEDLGF